MFRFFVTPRGLARIVAAGCILLAGHLAWADQLEPVRISPDGRHFELGRSNRPFHVWGVNYDHDRDGRLLEDYWHDEWNTVEADFAEMRKLGANVVRVHLQFGKFMDAPEKPNARNLAQLQRLLRLVEQNGLYLNLTGLGCYHKPDVPAWYDQLDEPRRWAAQARFWEAIAAACAKSDAIFCYDLMNEPVVAGAGKREDWLGPAFAGKHFVQFITLDLAGRDRTAVAQRWIATLVAAIRQHAPRHLVTVGLVDWSLDRPGLTSGFVPEKIAEPLDFVSVHVYPQSGKLEQAATTLRGFQVGKPLVVEETFPLKCTPAELEAFIDRQPDIAGWTSFYWGQTAQECRESGTIAGAITADWLERFQRRARR